MNAQELLAALQGLVNAVEAARVAEDNWIRSGYAEVMADAHQDAEATLIRSTNEARVVIAKAQRGINSPLSMHGNDQRSANISISGNFSGRDINNT